MGFLYSKYVQIGYEGALKPVDDVGIITTDGILHINVVNGKRMSEFRLFEAKGIYSGGRYQLHLPSGTYAIEMSFHFDDGSGRRAWSTSNILRVFTVAKGQVLHLSWVDKGRAWDVKESDGASALPRIREDFDELAGVK